MNSRIYTICLTGAAGNIGSTLIYQLLQPKLFSDKSYKVKLKLAELPNRLDRLKGLAMEVEDSFFDTLHSVEIYEDCLEAFSEADCIILCGARPRTMGMERKDLLGINAKVIERQAQLINQTATDKTKVLMIGNPSNTNALIFKQVADKINPNNITSLSQLDLHRALRLIEKEGSFPARSVTNVRVYGNHSRNMVIDVNRAYALVSKEKGGQSRTQIKNVLSEKFIEGSLQKIVQQRGYEMIKTLGCSVSYSAAFAICRHIRAWFCGSEDVLAVGKIMNDFMGSQTELCITLPVICREGKFQVVEGAEDDLYENQKKKIKAALKELIQEKNIAFELLQLN